ncbi:MAG: 3'-5' exonuclease [Acholeplasmataceae bacterium]|jgi:DNA polymerase III epsilon subunit family exonuclease|nr:3'-5' exonuclease [Acholeplasmataceae bacterium]
MLKNRYEHILVFDFETTGLSYLTNNIIEIGAVLLKRTPEGVYRVADELNCLIRQAEPLPAKIIEITGITDELLLNEGISEQEAFEKFQKLHKKDALLVAYNLSFDYAFLNQLYRKHFNDNSLFITNDVLDVMAIYKDRHPYPHRLESAVEKYNVAIKSTHRALDDVKATIEVLVKMIEERDSASKYINVIGYNPRYGPAKFKAPHVVYVPQYGNRLELEKR